MSFNRPEEDWEMPGYVSPKSESQKRIEKLETLINQLTEALKALRKYPHTYIITGNGDEYLKKDIKLCDAALEAAKTEVNTRRFSSKDIRRISLTLIETMKEFAPAEAKELKQAESAYVLLYDRLLREERIYE